MKEKLLNSLKKNWIIGVLITIIVFIIYISLDSSFRETKKAEEKPAKLNTISFENKYKHQPQSPNAYYINKIDSRDGVNGYSWTNNLLIYSTPQGVFSALNNQAIINKNIEKIMWSSNGYAVLLSNNQWSVLYPNGSLTSIPHKPLIISQNGNYYIYNKNGVESIISYTDSTRNERGLGVLLSQVVTSKNGTHISGIDNEGNLVFFDQSLNLQKKISIPSHTQILSISPDGNLVALGSRSKLHLINSLADQRSVVFSENSKIYANWISNTELFVVESYNNKLKIRVDEIWSVNSQGERKYTSSGGSVRDGLSNNQYFFPSKNNEVIPLIEYDGQLWLLSLKPNEFPIYNKEGLDFYFLESKGDSHIEIGE